MTSTAAVPAATSAPVIKLRNQLRQIARFSLLATLRERFRYGAVRFLIYSSAIVTRDVSLGMLLARAIRAVTWRYKSRNGTVIHLENDKTFNSYP